MCRPLGLKREGAWQYKPVGPTGLKTSLVSCYLAANLWETTLDAANRMFFIQDFAHLASEDIGREWLLEEANVGIDHALV